MSREQARLLVGRVLQVPQTRHQLPIRVRIIRLVLDEADPQRIVVQGIHIDNAGREAEGRTLVLTPTEIADYLEWPDRPGADHPRR
jgi:hypothetical protein